MAALIRHRALAALIAIGALGASPLAHAASEHVVLQLKWRHQFQFAGYYAAQLQGYYRDAGLDVEMHEIDFAHGWVDQLVDESVQFATGGAEGLAARMVGKPVVVLAVVYQHSPFCFVTRDPTINNPASLLDRTVMMADEQGVPELMAMMAREGLPRDRIHFVTDWHPEQLRTGQIDAVAAYTTDQFEVIWPGLRLGTLRPAEYGVDFYGDALFTSEAEIAEHPDTVRKFRAASLRGWEYAFAHPDELIDHILTLPGVAERGVTRAFLDHEVAEMRKLILPDLVDVGHVNPARFQRMAEIYNELGLHTGPYTLDGFFYDDVQGAARWPRWLAAALGALMLLFALAAAWAWQLRRAVRVRTRELARENDRRRIAEADLQASHAELEHRVLARTTELDHALAQMEAFSYSVSHDLRAPLRAIDGLLRIIDEDYGATLSTDARPLLTRVQGAARQMGQLIDDLLELSRMGRQPLTRAPIDMRAMIAAVYADLAPQREGRTIELVVGELPPCQADPVLLRQVLVNLLSNAIKFTRKRADARIEVTAESTATELIYRVADNGAGFEMEYASKLFNVFERMHPASQFEGTGVGLAIVKNVVTRHGGRVGATAALDAGATIWFALPRPAHGD